MVAISEILSKIQNLRHDVFEETKLLYNLITEKKPRIIVEFGTGTGATALAMALAIKDSNLNTKVLTIEIDSNHILGAKQKAIEFQLSDFIIFFNTTSIEFLKTLSENVDIVFIDSDHSFTTTLNELNSSALKLSENGIIALHDTTCGEIMSAINKFLEANPKYKFEPIKTEFGFGIISKKE